MKKLGKLTLSEMQDFVPLNPQEQMAMKGGMTAYQWAYSICTAWRLAGEISDAIRGSGGSNSTPTCPPGSTSVHRSDSTIFENGISVYGSQLICLPCQ